MLYKMNCTCKPALKVHKLPVTVILQLRRLKQVWTNEKERESLELEECKRLTFENSVLCQRIKTLEDETCHLADKLIKVS